MSFFIFFGDMLVMAFMIALVVWVLLGIGDREIDAAARLPLEDEDRG